MTDPPAGVETGFHADELPFPQMRRMFEWWLAARGGAGLPPDTAIDPMNIPRDCLPLIGVAEVAHDPLRLRSRLVGTAVVESVGVDHTGQYFDEIDGMGEAQMARFVWAASEGRPYLASDRLTFSPLDYKSYAVLTLPFAGEDGRVSRLMFVFGFSRGDGAPDT